MQPSKAKELLTFLHRANQLKTMPRFTASLKHNGDSVADHSWRLALMVYVIGTECKVAIDVSKAVAIALIHDLAEAKTGDIDAYKVIIGQASVSEKQKQEEEAIEEIVSGLSFGDWIAHTWESYESQESLEAKFVKALDKIEAFLHIAEVGIKDYVPPEFHGDYADQAVRVFDEATHHFPELKDLLDVVKAELKKQFIDIGVEWVEG